MESIGVRDLKQRASEILRRLEETGRPVAVTRRGRVVARLVPERRAARPADLGDVWAAMDELAGEIGARWPAGAGAVDAVTDQRRGL